MKKVLLALLIFTSINTAFSSTSSTMGEDPALQDCKDSIQTTRGQEEFDTAAQEIQESNESSSTSV